MWLKVIKVSCNSVVQFGKEIPIKFNAMKFKQLAAECVDIDVLNGFVVSKETVMLRRGRVKQKYFGLIKWADKGWIAVPPWKILKADFSSVSSKHQLSKSFTVIQALSSCNLTLSSCLIKPKYFWYRCLLNMLANQDLLNHESHRW